MIKCYDLSYPEKYTDKGITDETKKMVRRCAFKASSEVADIWMNNFFCQWKIGEAVHIALWINSKREKKWPLWIIYQEFQKRIRRNPKRNAGVIKMEKAK